MISFVILADGPANAHSFRPNDDETQWWSRRDALVRIVNMACYHGRGIPNPTTKDLIIFFNQFRENDERRMPKHDEDEKSSGDSSIAIMTPKNIASEIPTPTERSIIRILRRSFQRAENHKESLLNEGSCVCGHGAWNQTINSSTADLATSVSSPINGNRSNKRPKLIDPLVVGKKELVQFMQASCSIEFLRKHHLNASEDVVLKKFNKEKLIRLQSIWLLSQNDVNESGAEKVNSNICKEFERLVASFTVILTRCCLLQDHSTSGLRNIPFERSTILLLHEDYPVELGVFGINLQERENDSTLVPEHVVCILGGVRDAYEAEIKAIFAAAKRLGIRCVGANLGRTAEFTSKIVAALSSHAIDKRLHYAVAELQSISIETRVPPPKLPSIRKGNRSWNGHGNVSPMLHMDNLSMAQPMTIMKIVTRVHFPSTFVLADSTDREILQPLIQLIVNSIWKSRMANEIEIHDCCILDCCLHVLFSDGIILQLGRNDITHEIAKLHMAAPSEYQVLSMVRSFMERTGEDSNKCGALPDDALLECFKRALPIEYSKLERKDHLEKMIVYHVVGVQAIGKSIQHEFSGTNLNDIEPLSSMVYRKACNCSSNISNPDSSRYIYVILDTESTMSTAYPYSNRLVGVLQSWRHPHKSFRQENLVNSKLQNSIITTRVLNTSGPISCGYAVATLQHFAYHGRLGCNE